MRIGLITTLNTNIGDDLIREGICLVLQASFQRHHIEFVPVNKHHPLSVYPNWHPVHLAQVSRSLPRGSSLMSSFLEHVASKLKRSRFDTCDLIVQCGAPVLWPNCHQCDWAVPLWHHVVGRLSHRMPVLNLAAGSCYPWERQPMLITAPKDAEYLRAILGYCRLTTVRDALAKHLCSTLGVDTPLIPCSALLAARNYAGKIQHHAHGMVLINYMRGGGHYDWDQGIDPTDWREVVKNLISRLQTRHKIAFLCHDETEWDLAGELDSTIPRLWPKNPQEYFTMVSEATVALCNRMHASIALAGLGIPSIAVCTDTRLLMVDAIGLPVMYIKEAHADSIEEKIETLLATRRQERERLLAVQSATWKDYIQRIANAI